MIPRILVLVCALLFGGCASIMGTDEKCVWVQGPALVKGSVGGYANIDSSIQEGGSYRSAPVAQAKQCKGMWSHSQGVAIGGE